MAGKPHIPAFVDITADSYDQVIENEQRENLTPLELAMFIQRRLALGETQVEIARRLGKSQSYIAFASALIDAPEWLMRLYRQGRCRGINELYQLRRLYSESPRQVAAWAERKDCIMRSDVAGLKAQLDLQRATDDDERSPRTAQPASGKGSLHGETRPESFHGVPSALPMSPPSRRRPALLARHGSAVVELVLDLVPEVEGHVYVCPQASRDRACIEARELELLGFDAAQPGSPKSTISG
jgi:ParB family chromosome partitioning protein